jgi:hypothetical protein
VHKHRDMASAWVPDSATSVCSDCSIAFSLLTRRHHCRKCGLIFCANCSSARAAVPPQHLNRVRVCKKCSSALADEAARSHSASGGQGPPILRVHTTPEMAKSSYDGMARYYDLFSSYEAPHVAAGIDALQLTAGERVLEIGCGTGAAALDLTKRVLPGGHYVGLDISEKMLAKARGRLEASTDLPSGAFSFYAACATQPLPLPFAAAAAAGDEDTNREGTEDGEIVEITGRADPRFDALFTSFTLELFDTPMLPIVLASCKVRICTPLLYPLRIDPYHCLAASLLTASLLPLSNIP